jgi:chromosome segregation ATPase
MSQDIDKTAKQLKQLLSDVEDVERELKKQTEFKQQIRALRKNRDRMSEETYKLNVLSQALVNIRSLYSRTEADIADEFESHKTEYRWIRSERLNLSGLCDRVNQLLYGGGKGWHR